MVNALSTFAWKFLRVESRETGFFSTLCRVKGYPAKPDGTPIKCQNGTVRAETRPDMIYAIMSDPTLRAALAKFAAKVPPSGEIPSEAEFFTPGVDPAIRTAWIDAIEDVLAVALRQDPRLSVGPFRPDVEAEVEHPRLRVALRQSRFLAAVAAEPDDVV